MALPSPFRPRLGAALTALAIAATALTATAAPAQADNVVTPGNITAYGFDQCLAPTQRTMNTWLRNSPFLAVGIYIAGDSRGCRNQPNLTPDWVATQLRRGWRLLPITLGPQASCSPHFPRYGDDHTISPRAGTRDRYPRARKQARYWARRAVAEAGDLGIAAGSTLWYDLEGFDLSRRRCRESALAFLSAWTTKIHALDYVSGVYSSAGSGIKMLDDARVNRPKQVTLPDQIWIARWDGVANTKTSYIRDDGWLPGGRMKQYQGGHNETWGGVTINIDRNWLDLGKGSWAPPVEHCNGVDVDHPAYRVLEKGTGRRHMVRTLQCLLKEQGLYRGRIHGRYSARTIAAAEDWQRDHRFDASTTWTREHWMSLLAAGPRPVIKFGSAGEEVRRLQRALNAGRPAMKLPISGVFDRRTDRQLRKWQHDVGHRTTGVAVRRTWRALGRGRA